MDLDQSTALSQHSHHVVKADVGEFEQHVKSGLSTLDTEQDHAVQQVRLGCPHFVSSYPCLPNKSSFRTWILPLRAI